MKVYLPGLKRYLNSGAPAPVASSEATAVLAPLAAIAQGVPVAPAHAPISVPHPQVAPHPFQVKK